MNVAHRPFAQPPAAKSERFLLAGSVIAGRYRVIRPLGRGGMASVFLAEDTVLGESEVAIKILQDSFHGDSELVERFLREVRLTHKINHEHVVRTFDFGRDGQRLFYTMEYLPGMSLSDFIRKGGITVEEVVRFAAQLLKGVTAVHSLGVVHRDLKPSNIIVSGNGVLKITDFGVARLSSAPVTHMAADVLGTVIYVAPEVLRGEVATRAVDLYALGVILYELLTGEPPFNDDNPARVILRKLEEPPTPVRELRPDVPDWLARSVEDLLQREPEGRIDAARALALGIDSSSAPGSSSALYEELFLSAQEEVTPPVRTERRLRIVGALRYSLSLVQALLVVLGALVAIPVSTSELFSRIEVDHLDALFTWRGVRSPHPDVVVVSMDERSYASLNVPLTSAWPRALHATLLTTLANAGAKRVVFDVIFAGADATNEADRAFAKALERVPTVLGAALGFSQRPTMNGAFLLEELLQPEELFERESIGIGVVGLPQHSGRIRGFFLATSQVFPNVNSLAEVAVIPDKVGVRRPDENSLINFYGPSKSIPTVPYETVLRDSDRQFLRTVFENKIVFVGLGLRSSTGPSQRDAFITPFGADTFGTEIHATIASNLLQEDWIQQPKGWVRAGITACVAALISFIIIATSGGGAVLLLASAGAALLGAQFFLFMAGWFVPLISGFLWGVFSGLLIRIVLSPGVGRRMRGRALAIGIVFLSHGPLNCWATPHTWSEPTIPLLGEVTGGRFGAEVECSSPVLGSGTRSIIAVGAPRDGGGAGRVYLFDPADTTSPMQTLSADALDGVSAFGTQVQFIDDINGDGRDDLVVATSGLSPVNQGRVYGFLSSGAEGALQYGLCGSVIYSGVTDIQLQGIRANSGSDGTNLVLAFPGLSQTSGYRVTVGSDGVTCVLEPSSIFTVAAVAGSGYGSSLAQVGVGAGDGIAIGVAAPSSGAVGEVSLLRSQGSAVGTEVDTFAAAAFSGSVVAGSHFSDIFAVGAPRAAGDRGIVSVYRSSLAGASAVCSAAVAVDEPSASFGSAVAVTGAAFSSLAGGRVTTIFARRSQESTGGALVMFGANSTGCGQLYQFNNCQIDPSQEQASALAGGDRCQMSIAGVQRKMVLSGSPGWSSGRGRVDVLVEQDGPFSPTDCAGFEVSSPSPTSSAPRPILASPLDDGDTSPLPPSAPVTATPSVGPSSVATSTPPVTSSALVTVPVGNPSPIITPAADATPVQTPEVGASSGGEEVSIHDLTPIPVYPGATGLPAPNITAANNTVTVEMPRVKPQLQPRDQRRALVLLTKRRGLSAKKARRFLANPNNLVVTYVFTYERLSEARRFSLISRAHATDRRQSKKQRVTQVRSRRNTITLQRMPPGSYTGSYRVEVSLKKPRVVLGRSAPSATTRFRVTG